MSKRVFFTGGSGFVGQNMIPELIKEGYEVFALARSSHSAEKVKAIGAKAVMDDLTSLSGNTEEALQLCDYVVHTAAYMDFNYEKEKFYSINVDATKDLLNKAKRGGVKKFVYISAAPVVPGSPIVNLSEDQVNEGLPKALYPKTKALAEQAVIAAHADGFQTLSLRPPAIWGPNNHHMDEMLELVKQGNWVWLGGSKQVLSTIHVKNLSSAVVVALQSSTGGKAYFVTDGERRTMRESFSAIFKAHGVEPKGREIPIALVSGLAAVFEFFWKLFGITSRPPIPPLFIRLMGREFSVSDAKARKELGYSNVIDFEEGIREISQLQDHTLRQG
ncbi:MAG: NAD-dependent epimerase/dehydratase family protein [Bacteroidia bacterium]|nr:NAD-dependent epimerase/dehydratase family protein [Bacteroidia bacterium]